MMHDGKSKKRIFMIGYSEHKGGVETYIDQLTAALPQYEIVYSLPKMICGGKEWIRPENRHDYLNYRLFWRRFFRENRFDVLYFNTCDLVSIDKLKFAKKAGIPVRIIHAHSSGTQQAINKKLNVFHRFIERYNRTALDKYATHFFACSRAAGDWMFDGRPYTVINNGIHIEKYAFSKEKREAIRHSLGIENELLVGMIGRLSPPKNPSFSVQVLDSLIKKMPDANAVFLGDGELRQQTEDAVKKAGIQDNVRFLGNVDNVNEWLSAMDVLLMPSLFEGLPFVLVEAQANGLPCVVSSKITCEVDMTGLLRYLSIDSSPEQWADTLLQDYGRRNPDTGNALTSAGYNIDSTAQIVSDIIQKA